MTKDNQLRAEYLSHIEKQKSLGLSIKEYCKQNNLVEHKFNYYQHYKLKSTRVISKSFTQVQLKSDSSYPQPTKFNAIDPEWLAKFIKSLVD